MPHIPNQSSPARAPAEPDDPGDREQELKDRRRFGMERISLRKYEPDPKTILFGMFGDTIHVDPHTGQLVSTAATPAPGAPVGRVG